MMLRIQCLQQRVCLAEIGAGEASSETSLYSNFVVISEAPARVGIRRLRQWLEGNAMGTKILRVIYVKLAAHGLPPRTGTLAYATLIAAPSLTKNMGG